MLTAISMMIAMPEHSSAQSSQEDKQIESQATSSDDQPIGYPNWKTKTLGGKQFWTDVRYVGGWRIQQNSETGHCRLLSPDSTRHASGNHLHCKQKLDKLVAEGKARPVKGKVVIVLHGLIRTKSSMQPMANFLQKEGDFTAINLQYASTRNKVSEHAKALKGVIDGLGRNVTEINFVGHSLGNLVVRRYLDDTTDSQSGRQGDSRIRRMVMIGPPNQGSRFARVLKSSVAFRTIFGVSGVELSRAWEKLEPTLAIPTFEFGIIAGGQETEKGFSNVILEGKDDFTVSVSETKLAGAHDFVVKPLFHSTMMHQPEVLEATLCFLQNGYLVSESQRTPLTENDLRNDTRSRN